MEHYNERRNTFIVNQEDSTILAARLASGQITRIMGYVLRSVTQRLLVTAHVARLGDSCLRPNQVPLEQAGGSACFVLSHTLRQVVGPGHRTSCHSDATRDGEMANALHSRSRHGLRNVVVLGA